MEKDKSQNILNICEGLEVPQPMWNFAILLYAIEYTGKMGKWNSAQYK